MTNPVLPLLQIDRVKATAVDNKGFIEDMPYHMAEVNLHCKGQTDQEIEQLAKAIMERRVIERIGEMLFDKATKRPDNTGYYFDHRNVFVSGAHHSLERLLSATSISGEHPHSVYFKTPSLSNIVIETPALYIEEEEDGALVLNWYLAHIYVQTLRTTITQLVSPTNYLANFSIRYQVELAPGTTTYEHAGRVCIS